MRTSSIALLSCLGVLVWLLAGCDQHPQEETHQTDVINSTDAVSQETVDAQFAQVSSALAELKRLLSENAALEQDLSDMRETRKVGGDEMRKEVSDSLAKALNTISFSIERVRRSSYQLEAELTSHGPQGKK